MSCRPVLSLSVQLVVKTFNKLNCFRLDLNCALFSLLQATNFIMVSDGGKNFSQAGNYLQRSNSTKVRILILLSRPSTWGKERELFLRTADKELLE